jgi:PDZ domain
MERFTHGLWRRALLLGICAVLVGTGLCLPAQEAAPNASPPKASAEQMRQWLSELDSDSFDVREAAAEKLAQAGPAAVDVLASGIVSESAEIAWRSGASLERIAMSSDEKTLARITSMLDGMSAKGKPGLRSMAAEMHARQKHFRHDRAVASLKQNGAVFAGEGVEFGVGPVVMGGGMMVIGGADPFGGGVIIEEVAIDDPEPVAAGGIFGLLGKLLEGAAKIGAETAPAGDKPAREEKPAEERPVDVKPGEPAELLEEFKELAEPVAAPAAEDAQALAPPPMLAEPVEILEAGAMGFDFIGGGGIIGFDEGELETSASLMLGKQWRGGDDGLNVLKDVPEIWSISINGAKLTDASLDYVAQLPNLAILQIRDTHVSRQGLRKLREQKPDLQVQARGEAMMGVNADIGTSPLVLTSVFAESGAFQAGLREGDVIHSVDGSAIKDFADLTISIYGRKAGEKVRVEYERGGAKKTVEVTLKKRADDQ